MASSPLSNESCLRPGDIVVLGNLAHKMDGFPRAGLDISEASPFLYRGYVMPEK
jgi:hypothetical protein